MSFPLVEWSSPDGQFLLSTDPARLDLAVVHDYLANQSYWLPGVSRENVARAAANSLCFGLYETASGRQVGYARVVTDYTFFAYLCDVFVLEAFRGRGLGKWLVEAVLQHPDIPNPRRWLLATKDAHTLYTQHGFGPLADPTRWMVKMAAAASSPDLSSADA